MLSGFRVQLLDATSLEPRGEALTSNETKQADFFWTADAEYTFEGLLETPDDVDAWRISIPRDESGSSSPYYCATTVMDSQGQVLETDLPGDRNGVIYRRTLAAGRAGSRSRRGMAIRW
ncbi:MULTISPECIES: hypothetical protein [unclassified Corallococcus]|uniref:hypothetical protein n=1 Tax=unclassified Corallococcus TaxID=2685029 RepID=UPI001A8DA512|nr:MULTISPECIES: hypothetical protein [unclassified Corallococcus]MBN9687738.1 hypothetical protein [Corallococcus sp. NCSPR001]WAS88449.1 hypothetical protein O0N60_16025 [Corallococcus sp. NCRR]